MPEIPDDLRAALAGDYDLGRAVGLGGMANVYLARDLRHGRPVAVKVLRQDLTATMGSERFLREIEIAGGFVGLMSGGLLGIGFGVVTGDPGVGMFFVAAFAAAGAYVFPRSDFVNIANRHEKELQALGDRLVELAAGS